MRSVLVVVPVYNMPQDLLDRCLDSLDKQTYGNFTVVIVDDGSFVPVSGHHPKRFIYYTQHDGQAAAINKTLSMFGHFDYWCTVSGDDTVMPEYLSHMMSAIDRTPQGLYASPDSYAELNLIDILAGNYMHGGALFSMPLWAALGPLDTHPLWDWGWYCNLAHHGIKGASVHEHLYNWIPREGSVSRSLDTSTVALYKQVLKLKYGQTQIPSQST